MIVLGLFSISVFRGSFMLHNGFACDPCYIGKTKFPGNRRGGDLKTGIIKNLHITGARELDEALVLNPLGGSRPTPESRPPVDGAWPMQVADHIPATANQKATFAVQFGKCY